MTKEEQQNFVKGAFRALVERGVADSDMFVPSPVTEDELDTFEKKFDVKLPSLFRIFLSTYCYDFSVICAPIPVDEQENGEKWLWWIELLSLPKEEPLRNLYGLMESFREVCTNRELVGLMLDNVKNLLPIGEWDGTLCIDLTSGALCSFKEDEFDWKQAGYLDENGIAHGIRRMEDFKTLVEVYFYGKYDRDYERQIAKNNEEKPDYAAYIHR